MGRLLLPGVQPGAQAVERRQAADKELSGFALHKAAEFLLPLAQGLLRDAVAAVLVSEEIKGVPILAQAENLAVGEGVELLAGRQPLLAGGKWDCMNVSDCCWLAPN